LILSKQNKTLYIVVRKLVHNLKKSPRKRHGKKSRQAVLLDFKSRKAVLLDFKTEANKGPQNT